MFGRRVLKGRPREYRLGELLRPTFGMRVRDPERFDPERPDGWVQDHKGFDYRELRDELREWLPIEGTIATPLRSASSLAVQPGDLPCRAAAVRPWAA